MGMSVDANVAYGFTITPKEIDYSDPNWEDQLPEDAEEIDWWDVLKPFPALDVDWSGDSQWDEADRPVVIYVKSTQQSVGEGAWTVLSGLTIPTNPKVTVQIMAVRKLIPDHLEASECATLLWWSRG